MSSHFIASAAGRLTGSNFDFTCALGKGGVIGASAKTEGDGASPIGVWPMRAVYFRPDRMRAPQTGLALIPLREHDGWCDAPLDPLYNRPVRLPYSASHERLWRDDHAYDMIVELGYNDQPIELGRGSAIFMHVASPDYRPTEGCVALSDTDLRTVLAHSGADSFLEIRP